MFFKQFIHQNVFSVCNSNRQRVAASSALLLHEQQTCRASMLPRHRDQGAFSVSVHVTDYDGQLTTKSAAVDAPEETSVHRMRLASKTGANRLTERDNGGSFYKRVDPF